MRRIAGYKGSVAGHVMAVALAFQLAGTMWASGSGCDMEERILDADQDGLNDDLERQVFGTSLFTSDTDADGIPDGQEDHDDDGITNRDEQRNIQALGQAASEGDLATVRLLLRTGVQLDATDPVSGLTALACAARSGKEDVVTALLKAGADVNAAAWSSHFTPLMAAAGSGRASVVRLLLRAGADVNAQNEDGNTALWIASRYGRDEIVAILRSAGASR